MDNSDSISISASQNPDLSVQGMPQGSITVPLSAFALQYMGNREDFIQFVQRLHPDAISIGVDNTVGKGGAPELTIRIIGSEFSHEFLELFCVDNVMHPLSLDERASDLDTAVQTMERVYDTTRATRALSTQVVHTSI